MANEQTPNVMLELDKKIMADFEASLSEQDKADWAKAIEACNGNAEKIAEITNNRRNAAYAYACGKVEYACEQSGAGSRHETAYNFAMQKEAERDRILYGEGYDNIFKENVTGLDDVVDKNGKVKHKGLKTQYAEAEASNNTALMDELSQQIEAREAELEKVNNELTYWRAEDAHAYQQLDDRDNELDLLRAVQNGDEEAVKAAMLKKIEVFDNAGEPSIGSRSDYERYQAQKTEIAKYKEYLGIESEAAETIVEAEVETIDYSGSNNENVQTASDEKPNPYKFDITYPENLPPEAQSSWRSQEEMRLRNELDEQKAAEVMNTDGSIDADKLKELGNQGYNVAHIEALVAYKNKEKDGVSVENQTVDTAEVSESEAEGAAPADEKPNPYAFEKPERESNESDADYENRCKLAEAEHIDNVNREFAAAINRGEYGNGEDRKAALAAAGADYDAVQSIINNEYAPLYKAEAEKQAAAAEAAKQGGTIESMEDVTFEAKNDNQSSVAQELDEIRDDMDKSLDEYGRTLAGDYQSVIRAADRKAKEGTFVSDEDLQGGTIDQIEDTSFEDFDFDNIDTEKVEIKTLDDKQGSQPEPTITTTATRVSLSTPDTTVPTTISRVEPSVVDDSQSDAEITEMPADDGIVYGEDNVPEIIYGDEQGQEQEQQGQEVPESESETVTANNNNQINVNVNWSERVDATIGLGTFSNENNDKQAQMGG